MRIHCSKCWTAYTVETFPFTCTTEGCGHVLQSENVHPVNTQDALLGRLAWETLQEIQKKEDAQIWVAS